VGKYYVKFGHFVNLSHTYYRAKMSCSPPPPKLTDILYAYGHGGVKYAGNSGVARILCLGGAENRGTVAADRDAEGVERGGECGGGIPLPQPTSGSGGGGSS